MNRGFAICPEASGYNIAEPVGEFFRIPSRAICRFQYREAGAPVGAQGSQIPGEHSEKLEQSRRPAPLHRSAPQNESSRLSFVQIG
jgi:hypothetical protein